MVFIFLGQNSGIVLCKFQINSHSLHVSSIYLCKGACMIDRYEWWWRRQRHRQHCSSIICSSQTEWRYTSNTHLITTKEHTNTRTRGNFPFYLSQSQAPSHNNIEHRNGALSNVIAFVLEHPQALETNSIFRVYVCHVTDIEMCKMDFSKASFIAICWHYFEYGILVNLSIVWSQ